MTTTLKTSFLNDFLTKISRISTGLDEEAILWDHLINNKEISEGCLSDFCHLLRQIPDPFQKQMNRPSSFFYLAIEKGHARLVQILINFSAQTGCLFEVLSGTYCDDSNETTPLHQACKIGNADVIKILLDAGSLLLVTDLYSGCLPLTLAIESQKYEAVKVILEHAENLGILQEVLNPPLNNPDELSPVQTACKAGDGSIISLLLRARASIFNPATAAFY